MQNRCNIAGQQLQTLLDVTCCISCTPSGRLLGVVGSCCTKFENSQIFSHVQMAAITPNIVEPTMLRVVASVNTEFDSRKMNVNWKV